MKLAPVFKRFSRSLTVIGCVSLGACSTAEPYDPPKLSSAETGDPTANENDHILAFNGTIVRKGDTTVVINPRGEEVDGEFVEDLAGYNFRLPGMPGIFLSCRQLAKNLAEVFLAQIRGGGRSQFLKRQIKEYKKGEEALGCAHNTI